jgi:hypothetical protein
MRTELGWGTLERRPLGRARTRFEDAIKMSFSETDSGDGVDWDLIEITSCC